MSAGYAYQLRASLEDHAVLPAISFPEEPLTYADLARRIGGVARVLSEAGLQPG